MKKGLGLLGVIGLMLLLSACSGEKNSGREVKTDAVQSESENTYHTNLNDSNSSKLSFGGLSVRIPSEFGGPSPKSKGDTQYFYLPQQKQNHVVMFSVNKSDVKATNEQFDKERTELVSGFMKALGDFELKERKSVVVAGLPAERIYADGTIEGFQSSFDAAIVFSEENGTAYAIEIGTVQENIQEYRNTLDNILGSASVSSDMAYEFAASDILSDEKAGGKELDESETGKSDATALEQNLNDLLGGSDADGSINNATENASGVSPEFKAALDSYERFFDEYIAIMNRMKSNPSDLSILSQYADYMGRYADMLQKFEAMEKQDMTKEEMAYYLEVSNRITQKLLNAM